MLTGLAAGLPPDLRPSLGAARQAVQAAGQIQLEGLGTALRVEHKGRFDLVTEVDRRCQDAILSILRAELPGARVRAEEGPAEPIPGQGEVWLVDPLDGTTNFAHGFPMFSTTLALRRDGQTVLGVVLDPLRGERFEAVRGAGAWLNDCRLRVSRTDALADALLATGFPYDRSEHPDPNLRRFAALTLCTQGVRRGGSASLDLCYVAAGRLDGYWELRIEAWDIAAGALCVEEAGGRVTNLAGGPHDGSGRETLASNGLIHAALAGALSEAGPG